MLLRIPKKRRHISGLRPVRAAVSIRVFDCLWLIIEHFKVLHIITYVVSGNLGVLIVNFIAVSYPLLPKSYCLLHVPTLFSDGRRQILVVFARFLLVGESDYSAASSAPLF